MKREDLKALIPDITDDQLDKVMNWNGADIEKHKTAAESAKTELAAAKARLVEADKAIEGFKALDVDGIKAAAEEWKQKAEQAEREAAQKIDEMEFNAMLDGKIAQAKGRNAKAIRALLDMEALRDSKNREGDADKAIAAVLQENGYLFETGQPPAPHVVRPTSNTRITPENFKSMSYMDKLKLKNEQPDLYKSLKAEKNGGND